MDHSHFFKHPIQRGKVYPALFLTKQQFYSVKLPENNKKFIIIQD